MILARTSMSFRVLYSPWCWNSCAFQDWNYLQETWLWDGRTNASEFPDASNVGVWIVFWKRGPKLCAWGYRPENNRKNRNDFKKCDDKCCDSLIADNGADTVAPWENPSRPSNFREWCVKHEPCLNNQSISRRQKVETELPTKEGQIRRVRSVIFWASQRRINAS